MKRKENKIKLFLTKKYSIDPYINYSISKINTILFHTKTHLTLCYKEMTLNLPFKEIINDYSNCGIWNFHRVTIYNKAIHFKCVPFFIDKEIEEMMIKNKKLKNELNDTISKKENESKEETFFNSEQMKMIQTPVKNANLNESIKDITNLIYQIEKNCTQKKKEDKVIKENIIKQSTKKKKKPLSLINNENINISNFNIKRVSTITQFESNITKTKSFKSTKSFLIKERDKKEKLTQRKSKIIISLTNKIFLSPKNIHSPISPKGRNFFYIPPTNQKIAYQKKEKKPIKHQSKPSSFNQTKNHLLSLHNPNHTYKISSITSLPYIKL